MGTINDMSDAELLPLLRYLFPWLFERPQLTPGTLVRRLPGGGVLDDGTVVQLHGDHALNGVVLSNRAGGSAPGRMSAPRRIVGRRISGLAGGAVTRALMFGFALAGDYSLNAPRIIAGAVARNWTNILLSLTPGVSVPGPTSLAGLGSDPGDLSGFGLPNYSYTPADVDGNGNPIEPLTWWKRIAYERDGGATIKPIYTQGPPGTQLPIHFPGEPDNRPIYQGEWAPYGILTGIGYVAGLGQYVRIGTSMSYVVFRRAIRPTATSAASGSQRVTQYSLYLEVETVTVTDDGQASEAFTSSLIGRWDSDTTDENGHADWAYYDGRSPYTGDDPDTRLLQAMDPYRLPLPDTEPQFWEMRPAAAGTPVPVAGPVSTVEGTDPALSATAWFIPCEVTALVSERTEDGSLIAGPSVARGPVAIVDGQRVPGVIAPGGIIVTHGPDLPDLLSGVLTPEWVARDYSGSAVVSLGNSASWLAERGVNISPWNSRPPTLFTTPVDAVAVPAATFDGLPAPQRLWTEQPNAAPDDNLSSGPRTVVLSWPGSALGPSLRVGLIVTGLSPEVRVLEWTYEHPDYGPITWEPTDGWQEQLKQFREEQLLNQGDQGDFNRAGTLSAIVELKGAVWSANLLTC